MHTTFVRVWDWPLRLFHWGLVACVAGSITTIHLGGDWMEWHARFGYGAAGLLAFRLVWGFIGSRHSRFASFIYSPRETLRYAQGRSRTRYLGHNPLGALSVFAMLAALCFQAFGGLFTGDDILFEAPLAHLVSSDTVSWLTGLHKRNQWLIYGFLGMHIAAVMFYTLVKREKLIPAMLHGRKPRFASPPAPSRPRAHPGLGANTQAPASTLL